MSNPVPAGDEFEQRIAARLRDGMIRAGLIAVLAALCYVVFSPFLPLMAWALILAVTIYPLHRRLARRIGGRQGLAATIIVILGCVIIVAPTALLMNSFGTSVHDFVNAVRDNTLKVPEPREKVKEWPVVGEKVYSFWREPMRICPPSSRACSRRSGRWPARLCRSSPASASAS